MDIGPGYMPAQFQIPLIFSDATLLTRRRRVRHLVGRSPLRQLRHWRPQHCNRSQTAKASREARLVREGPVLSPASPTVFVARGTSASIWRAIQRRELLERIQGEYAHNRLKYQFKQWLDDIPRRRRLHHRCIGCEDCYFLHFLPKSLPAAWTSVGQTGTGQVHLLVQPGASFRPSRTAC